MNVVFPLFFISILVGLLLDIWLKKYEYNNKYFNYFLVFIMIFGHPIYFSFSLLIAFFTDRFFSNDILFNNFTYVGYIVLILSALLFALLRYAFYIFIIKKNIKNFNLINLYRYSRFYIFTIFGLFLYISTINQELEFYLVYMYQVFLPILIIYALAYTVLKYIITSRKK